MANIHDPIDDFLVPLLRLGLNHPEIEGHVLWAEGGRWQPQDECDEGLDGEEIAYYAEGLLLEGFALRWMALAAEETRSAPAHVLMYFRERPEETEPPIPAPPVGWEVTAQDHWPADTRKP